MNLLHLMRGDQFRRHAWYVMGLCTLVILLVPSFRFKNLFLKGMLPVETLFSVSPNADQLINASVKIIKNDLVVFPFKQMGLKGDTGGQLLFQVPPSQGKIRILLAHCRAAEGGGQAVVWRSLNEDKFHILSTDRWMERTVFDLTQLLAPDLPHEIGLLPLNSMGRIVVNEFSLKELDSSHALPPLDAALPFLVFVFLFSWSIGKIYQKVHLMWITGISTAAIFAYGIVAHHFAFSSPWFWLLLLTAILCYRAKLPASHPVGFWAHEWFWIPFSMGLIFRWRLLEMGLIHPLTGDPVGYHRFALDLVWANPFANGIREPFYIWAQSLGANIFGPNAYQFRFMNVLFSIGIVWLTYRLVLKVTNLPWVALLATFFVASSDFAVYSSVLGERSEFFSFLVMIFALILFYPEKPSWKTEIAAGVVGAFISLTWLFGMGGVLLVYGFRTFQRRVPAKKIVAAGVIFLALLVPYLLSQWIQKGDPLYAINYHLSYYQTAETGDRLGEGDVQKSWILYLIQNQGIGQIVTKTLVGSVHLYLNPFNRIHQDLLGGSDTQAIPHILYPFFLLGVGMELKKRRYELLCMMILFTNIAHFRYLFRINIEP